MSQSDALELAEVVVDRLCEAHDLPIDRDSVHVGIARWNGRHGVAKYNRRLNGTKEFGARMTSIPRSSGDHTIVINAKILDQGRRDDFIDVIQHELAHAVAYEEYGGCQGHNENWKQEARKLGADPKSRHERRDRSDEFQYYIYCPECGTTSGRTKRSKLIKEPFNRKCGNCGHHPMSSYEDGQTPPDESGVVAVESLNWDNRQEWVEAGKP